MDISHLKLKLDLREIVAGNSFGKYQNDAYLRILGHIKTGKSSVNPLEIGYKWVDQNYQPSFKNQDRSLNSYKPGTKHQVDPPIQLCHRGLHACRLPEQTRRYWTPRNDHHLLEVSLSGELDEGHDKVAAQKLKVLRELPHDYQPEGWTILADSSQVYNGGNDSVDDLPAVITRRQMIWKKNGKLHRKHGPAVITCQNTPIGARLPPIKEYYLHGRKVSELECLSRKPLISPIIQNPRLRGGGYSSVHKDRPF